MAKSMRSKKEKRLRAIRREIVEPFYDNKDAAKLAAQEAALAAPKLPARPSSTSTDTTTTTNAMDVEMADENQNLHSLKPTGGIGKKSNRKFKMGKGKRRGKGIRRKHHI
ncbi:uncharacterized protein LOC133868799 isoform X1 [Alnus glutinosa]|uniref:uncharacterized protein LOC133868799 isoform X1 n=1 Tax=Alnus glutinosa TaxID=3517 RepID=UPI002D786348|nr:uncharacterized protein LOC133868799 isoform X1 [Alnus glutinosa]